MILTSTPRLARCTLGVAHLDRSEVYYRDVLGLATTRRADAVVVAWPGLDLELHAAPPASRAKVRLYFLVATRADVDALAKRLRSAGQQLVRGPALSERGEWAVGTIDPDDYELVFYSEAGSS
ncbi:MAG: VOC family protein [Vulcanimicrobiaceae bacterium]